MKCIIITNNSLVAEKIHKVTQHECDVLYKEEYSFLTVLEHARNLIHKGHALLTHPLSGSIKPYETPFKTVVVSKSVSELDINSLDIIERAIETTKKFLSDYNKREFTDKIYDDFRLIDYSLIKGAIEQMNGNVVVH